jgi:enhancer of yellow 2 transcription factor
MARDEVLSQSEVEKVKHAVMQRLIQTGWRDRVKDQCFSVLASKRGRQISVEQLISEVTPFARNIVPATVKSELLESVRDATHTVKDSRN